MIESVSTTAEKETAVLVALITQQQNEQKVNEYLDELAFLVETSGAITLKRFTQRTDKPDVTHLRRQG